MRGARFVERVAMARYVSLFLFETDDGRPVGQFLDGLRAVWEPPHMAEVKIRPAAVDLRCDAPNSGQEARPSAGAGINPDGFIADVGDGCQPRLTTALGKRGTMRKFRAALAAAQTR